MNPIDVLESNLLDILNDVNESIIHIQNVQNDKKMIIKKQTLEGIIKKISDSLILLNKTRAQTNLVNMDDIHLKIYSS